MTTPTSLSDAEIVRQFQSDADLKRICSYEIQAYGEAQYQRGAAGIAERDQRIAKVKQLVDLYFMPWGAAKAALCEDAIGDVGFAAESVLTVIQRILAQPTSTASPDGKEVRS